MNPKNLTAAQLHKVITRFRGDPREAAMEWAERVEAGPRRSCIPKKKLRAAGLLPPVAFMKHAYYRVTTAEHGEIIFCGTKVNSTEKPGFVSLISPDGRKMFELLPAAVKPATRAEVDAVILGSGSPELPPV